jgi:hypothetical protein
MQRNKERQLSFIVLVKQTKEGGSLPNNNCPATEIRQHLVVINVPKAGEEEKYKS